ncbi:hypothetical protein SH528x_002363 [Novipirellula sp. SH528]|uniref:hypothetical protein n=1 Tax=Novipirellula sp. SH528 TaxID=3454466 RepID=UPI003FA021B7
MIPIKATCFTLFATAVFAFWAGIPEAQAQPPRVVQADMDYAGSGYVTPAGMVPPTMYNGTVMPLGMQSGVMPVGFNGPACDSGGCDSPYGDGGLYGGMIGSGCDGSCGGGCDGGCGYGEDECDAGIFGGCGCGRCRMLGRGGLLGRVGGNATACGGCAREGCPACGGRTNLRFLCMFCRGDGCEACQFVGRGYLLGAMGSLLPYRDAGRCAQRWYDLSVEGLFLSHNDGNGNGVLTTQGVSGTPVLRLGDAESDDLEAGVRLSAAMIFGAGGNMEFTYMGGQEWDGRATVNDPNAQLFSVISDFGVTPAGGFDDTDQSLSQSIGTQSSFDSFELNYRRRTMGPYCRFQGSWLVGLRHIRYDDQLIYSTVGLDNNGTGNDRRFFTSSDRNKNRLFGPQAGFDLWYNVMPGINLGLGAKGAWMQNDVKRNSFLAFNSEAAGATPGSVKFEDGNQESTVMGEFEATLLYRLSHSWTLRSAYYLIGVDDVHFGTVDAQNIRNFSDSLPGTAPGANRNQTDQLVIQGFSIGAEYIW